MLGAPPPPPQGTVVPRQYFMGARCSHTGDVPISHRPHLKCQQLCSQCALLLQLSPEQPLPSSTSSSPLSSPTQTMSAPPAHGPHSHLCPSCTFLLPPCSFLLSSFAICSLPLTRDFHFPPWSCPTHLESLLPQLSSHPHPHNPCLLCHTPSCPVHTSPSLQPCWQPGIPRCRLPAPTPTGSAIAS